MLSEGLAVACALLLAFANGANDNPKGVATLLGARALSYRGAVALATASTALGSLLSFVLAGALLPAFSGKGLVPDAALTAGFRAAVAFGAAAAVLAATRLGLPVSTTHALVGALVGAGFVAAGAELRLDTLGSSFVMPLALGPLLAGALALGLRRVVGGWRGKRGPGLGLMSGSHLASASLVGFARGVNDTPKILALLLGAGVPTGVGVVAVTAAMALGGLIAARPVAETLAHRLTTLPPGEGLTANLTTALLVVGASRLGLPLSTTHVVTGSIAGVGLARGDLSRRVASRIGVAWLLTLPCAAAAAAFAAWALG